MLRALLAVSAALTSAATVWSEAPPTIGSCPIFPADNIWNTRVDQLPVDPNSDDYVNSIGVNDPLHPDFGSGEYFVGNQPFGIPFTTVVANQPLVPIFFIYYDESDPGPWPIPRTVPIEGGAYSRGDRHILVIDTANCRLYEAWKAYPLFGSKLWIAGSGATWDLTSNALRPSGWTSADAAGLPIFAGLVRFDEVNSGEIRHALRFTVSATRNQFVWPARHKASSNTDPKLPPMGQRFRLKATFDTSGYSPHCVTILTALKTYGMMLSDNGSDWFLSGAPDSRWDDDVLNELKQVRGSDFEAVDVSSLMVDPDSGQAAPPNARISGPSTEVRVPLRPRSPR